MLRDIQQVGGGTSGGPVINNGNANAAKVTPMIVPMTKQMGSK